MDAAGSWTRRNRPRHGSGRSPGGSRSAAGDAPDVPSRLPIALETCRHRRTTSATCRWRRSQPKLVSLWELPRHGCPVAARRWRHCWQMTRPRSPAMPDDATLPQLRALADEGARLAHGVRCAGPRPRTAPAPPPDPHERGCRIGHRRRARGRCLRGDRPVDEPGRAVLRRPGPDCGTQHDSGSRPAHRRADAAGAAYAELTEWMEDCAGGDDYEVAVQSSAVLRTDDRELLGGGFDVRGQRGWSSSVTRSCWCRP
jgi:hypothetical protein